jgi:hypothetical protein
MAEKIVINTPIIFSSSDPRMAGMRSLKNNTSPKNKINTPTICCFVNYSEYKITLPSIKAKGAICTVLGLT